jgi:hypothetical protein
VFLTLMIVGLVGLLSMAMPAFARHGHVHHVAHGGRALFVRGGGHPRVGGGGKADLLATSAGDVASAASAGRELARTDAPSGQLLRLVPSPRAVFSVLSLYGAFGNALVRAAHLPAAVAAVAALVPALLVETAVVRPIWNLVFRFQGQPSSPLDALLLSEARAVVPFRNGRGLVSVVRDGRIVQLAASLRGDHAALPVRVGDLLQVEEVDARQERLIVSVLGYPRDS